jgi:hypothetical protein
MSWHRQDYAAFLVAHWQEILWFVLGLSLGYFIGSLLGG